MGIKHLRKFLDKYAPSSISSKKYNDFKNKSIAIDTSLIIYKYISATRKSGKDLTSSDGRITSHIFGILNLINKLISHKITPVFVFDGPPPSIKKNTLKKRQTIKNTALENLENSDLSVKEKISYFMQATKISPEIIEDTKKLLTYLGIPWIDSPEEADAQCVCLLNNGIVDAVATEDMDLLTFGCKKLLRNFFSTKEDDIVEIELDKILKELKLTQSQFIDVCILLGCDYLPTLEGIGFVKTYNYIIKYGSLDNIVKIVTPPENYNYQEVQNYFIESVNKCNVPNKNDMIIKKTNNDDIYKLIVTTFNFNVGKYNSFIVARNKFFE